MSATSFLDRLGRGLKNPLVQAAAFYFVFLAVALAGRAAGEKGVPILAGAALMTLYSVANPVSLVFVPRFWLSLLLSLAAWLLLFAALAMTIDAWEPMREGAMVFLGAMMIFPVALFAAGIARLIRRRPARPRGPS